MTSNYENHGDTDPVTKHVIDYYQKYSQNPDLPKYFSGSSLSYLPEFRENVSEDLPKIIIQADFDLTINEEKNEPENISRASSAMSNKKLEWDNGADIGYDNCHKFNTLRKCYSLPIITNKNKKNQNISSEPILMSKPDKSDDQSNRIKLLIFTHSDSEGTASDPGILFYSKSSSVIEEKKLVPGSSSSSSDGNPPENKLVSSSSSNSLARSVSDKKPSFSSDSSSAKNISDFISTLSYLKKKIGLPDAQSTPQSIGGNKDPAGPLITVTPMISNLEKKGKNLLGDYKNSSGAQNKHKLNNNSKIVDEFTQGGSSEIIDLKHVKKSVKLCLTKPVFVECISSNPGSSKKDVPVQVEQVSVSIQTDPLLGKDFVQRVERHSIVENQGLEFCEHSDSDPNAVSTQTGSELIESNCNSFQYMKNNETQKNSSSNSACQTPKSIRKNDDSNSVKEQSDSSEDFSIECNKLSDDIEKNATILQKLLKSKKYDNSKKKRYIKKLLEKIMESKYLEESSNSSEMFLPKKVKASIQNVEVPPREESSSKSSQSHTCCSQCYKSSPRKRKQLIRPLVTETKTSVYKEDAARHSDKDVGISQLVEPSDSSRTSKLTSCSTSILDKVDFSSSFSKLESRYFSYQNWKEDKTYSEKMIEEKSKSNGEGDFLNGVAVRHRESKIKLINDKIEYLGKLKNDLQNRGSKNEAHQKKSTAVYLVSDETDLSGDQQRKYVIETNVCSHSSRHKKFKIGDKKYNVKELSKSKNVENVIENLSHALNDIEVVATKDVMNIKVTTVCEDCERAACACENTGSYTNTLKQRSVPTSDNNEPLAKRSDKSPRVSHLCCHTSKNNTKASLGGLQKHCPLCNLYTCGCTARISAQTYDEEGKENRELYRRKSDSSLVLVEPILPSEAEINRNCRVCLECPCRCDSSDQSGSLKRVFENCTCKSQSACDCGFVNKLLQHFKSSNDLKSDQIKPKTDDIQVQTDFILVSSETQAHSPNDGVRNEKSKEVKYGTVGVQCEVEMQHASSQMTRDLKSCSCQTSNEQTLRKEVDVNAKTIENVGIQVSGPLKKEQVSQVDRHRFQSTHQQTDDIVNLQENIKDVNIRMGEKLIQISSGTGSSKSVSEMSEKLRKMSSESSEITAKFDEKKINKPKNQTTPSVVNYVSSTAISPNGNSTSTSTSSTAVMCICCKKATDKNQISFYRCDNEEYPLCVKCINKKPILTSVCYSGPGYICSCSEVSHISKEPQEYCSCVKPFQYKNRHYCGHCQFKLRKTLKSKNGIAYTLTLEYKSPKKHKSKRTKKRELQEIRVKIPGPYGGKKNKDKENFNRKEKMKPKVLMEESNDSTQLENKTSDDARQCESVKNDGDNGTKVKRYLTLQEHLMQNRPDFIDSAEYRRHILLNSKQDREVRKDDVRIKFLEENACTINNNRLKLFTEREMRDITKKNYKKLPEVQQRMKNNRERVLRNADKFIVNTLTKRIQKSILKGKTTFPIDTNIVDVYK